MLLGECWNFTAVQSVLSLEIMALRHIRVSEP